MILDGNATDSIAKAVALIRANGIISLPTETVYGLGADAASDEAVAKIFAAKGRPSDHPLIVHVASVEAVSQFASDVPAFAQTLMAAFWPGPLTVILPRRAGVATASAGGQDSIGLRCPSHPVAQALLMALFQNTTPDGQPARVVWGIAAPSANRFGRVSPTSAAHVQDELGSELLILDGGDCEVGIESTIVDCTRGVPVLLRPGQISRAQLAAICKQAVLLNEELPEHILLGQSAAPKASGTLESHYAPNAKVRLMDAKALQAALHVLGNELDAKPPTIAVYARAVLKSSSSRILRRRMPDDAAATAHQLFAVLREFDAQGMKLIWIETPPADPDWDGVRDRLQRAAAA